MRVKGFTLGTVAVIRVDGPLDHASADALREGACGVLLRPQRVVVVSLEGVHRADAAGLGALADVHRMAASVGGWLTLTNVRPRIREILDAVALTGCFEIAASECDAVEDLDACMAP